MWSNYNNLREFMKQSELNVRQARWALKLAAYDFEIHHRVDKNNSTNELSRRLDYKRVSLSDITLLSTLQNKLLLTNKELSLKRRNSTKIDSLSIINVVISAIDWFNNELSQNKRKLSIALSLVFRLTDVQIVISRKIVRDMLKIAYEKSHRSMKFLIKKLQIRN